MSALLEARLPDGTLVGRCDQNCYNGTGKKCLCICRGRNHGVGKIQAMLNNTAESLAAATTAVRTINPKATITLFKADLQLPLPLTE